MDCPCGRATCTCRESKCKRAEGCLCFSCSEWMNKKCGLCGFQIPASYFSEADSIREKESNTCQCFMTDDHGINLSIPVQAQASSECEDVNTVIPRCNLRIFGSSLTPTGRPERLSETEKYQNNESPSLITSNITLSHPHQERYETGRIYTNARFPIPPRQQNNRYRNFNSFRRNSLNPYQQRYENTRLRNRNYILPHMYSSTYIIPILKSSTPYDLTLDLPEGTTDERRRRSELERGVVPFYSPEENMRSVFPDYQYPRPVPYVNPFPYHNPFQNVPNRMPMAVSYRHWRRRHWRPIVFEIRSPTPKSDTPTREKVETWLRENFAYEPSPDSSDSSKIKELFAELPFADNESVSSGASTASTSLLKYLKDGTWSSSGSV